jgi:hypothetical protein
VQKQPSEFWQGKETKKCNRSKIQVSRAATIRRQAPGRASRSLRRLGTQNLLLKLTVAHSGLCGWHQVEHELSVAAFLHRCCWQYLTLFVPETHAGRGDAIAS